MRCLATQFDWSLTVLVAVLAASLGGCATQRYDRQMVAAETYTINAPQTVFDSPQTIAARANRPPTAADVPTNDRGQPWWTTRNDDRLAVRPGSDEVDVTAYSVYVRDRQYWSGDHARNTYRREFRSATRGLLVP